MCVLRLVHVCKYVCVHARHGGAVVTDHTPTPSHSPTTFRAGGWGGRRGLGLWGWGREGRLPRGGGFGSRGGGLPTKGGWVWGGGGAAHKAGGGRFHILTNMA